MSVRALVLSPDHAALRRDIARFVLLSGGCWLLDASLLLLLNAGAHWPLAPANIASSLVAAAVVYVLAHHRIHRGADRQRGQRLAFYLCYTLGVILLASWSIAQIGGVLRPLLGAGLMTALAAKILITPPQLFCNFCVSRFVARFGQSHGIA